MLVGDVDEILACFKNLLAVGVEVPDTPLPTLLKESNSLSASALILILPMVSYFVMERVLINVNVEESIFNHHVGGSDEFHFHVVYSFLGY